MGSESLENKKSVKIISILVPNVSRLIGAWLTIKTIDAYRTRTHHILLIERTTIFWSPDWIQPPAVDTTSLPHTTSNRMLTKRNNEAKQLQTRNLPACNRLSSTTKKEWCYKIYIYIYIYMQDKIKLLHSSKTQLYKCIYQQIIYTLSSTLF